MRKWYSYNRLACRKVGDVALLGSSVTHQKARLSIETLSNISSSRNDGIRRCEVCICLCHGPIWLRVGTAFRHVARVVSTCALRGSNILLPVHTKPHCWFLRVACGPRRHIDG